MRKWKRFIWQQVKKEVAAFVKTCHVCQLTWKPNQRIEGAQVCPALAVDSAGVMQESDDVPEPDDGLWTGRLKNSESLHKNWIPRCHTFHRNSVWS